MGFKNLKLGKKLFLISILPMIASIVIITIVNFSTIVQNYQKSARNWIESEGKNSALKIDLVIDRNIQEMNLVEKALHSNADVGKESIEKLLKGLQPEDRAYTYHIAFENKEMFLGEDGVDLTGYDPTSRPWYQDAKKNSGKIIFNELYIDPLVGGGVMTLSKEIKLSDGRAGVLAADIPLTTINEQLKGLSNENVIVQLVDDQDNILFATDQSKGPTEEGFKKFEKTTDKLTKSKMLDNVEREITVSEIENTGWLLYCGINSELIFGSVRTYLIISTIAIAIIILATLFVSKMASKSIAVPINSCIKVMNKLSNYDFDTREERKDLAKYLDRKEELGDMTKALTKLRENLTAIVKNIQSLAQNTAATAEELTATAQSTSGLSREVSQAVGNIADGATSQAHDTQDASSSVNTTNTEVTQMLEILNMLNKSIDIINAKKDEGSISIDELVKAVEKTNQSSREVKDIIDETSQSAEKISSSSEMIQSISDQTNLLALNAAIEIAVGM